MCGSSSWLAYGAQGVKGLDDDDDDNDGDYLNDTVNIQMVCFIRLPNISNRKQTKLHIYIYIYIFQCHHMTFVDFVVLPRGHGRSVTDF